MRDFEGTYANGNRSVIDVPVLIAGSGPIGLLAAYLLAQQNIRCLIVEKYPSRLASPKAHALSPRSLEICRQVGISVQRIRQLGTPREQGSQVRFVSTVAGDEIGYLPYERQDTDVLEHTSEMITNIAQPTFEKLLTEEYLANSPNVEIRKGVEFLRTEEHPDGHLTTRLRERNGGREYDVCSNYLIGCDGANSKVRTSLGITTTGEDAFDHMMTITFSADLTKINGGRDAILYWIFNPAARGFIINYDATGLQALNHPYDPVKEPTSTFTKEKCEGILREAFGAEVDFQVIAHLPWTLQRRVADSYSRGRVFLAGDSAHSFPPTGGLGLNSGIADIHALVWRLAAVYHGTAKESILRDYELERRPVAVNNGLQSVKNGVSILKLLRILSSEYDHTDASKARQLMHEKLLDPEIKAQIDVEVQGQREHFDNLGLHIGYSYADPKPPHDASVYVPRYSVGARVPHAWITLPDTSALRKRSTFPAPVDLSYIKDAPKNVSSMRFSTMDLVLANHWTVVVSGESTLDPTSLSSRLPSNVPVVVVKAGQDFDEVDTENSWQGKFGLLENPDAAVVTRPDQHVGAIVKGMDELVASILAGVGRLE